MPNSLKEGDLFESVFQHCEAALEGGFLSQERAAALLEWLASQPTISRIYPNNLLLDLLKEAVADPRFALEPLLLDFISEAFLGFETPEYGIGMRLSLAPNNAEITSDEIRDRICRPPTDWFFSLKDYEKRHPAFTQWEKYFFDELPPDFSLQGVAVNFTGKFASGTRKQCHEQARLAGAAQSGYPAVHVLFIANNFAEMRACSGTCQETANIRRMRGIPLIMTEADWEKLRSH